MKRCPEFVTCFLVTCSLLATGCSRQQPNETTSTQETPQPGEKTDQGQSETTPNGPKMMTPFAMLIEPEELAEQLNEQQVRILDVRSADAYAEGHIPGAVRVDVGAWKQQAFEENGFHDDEAWSTLIGSSGISRESRVVVYGDRLTDASRVWWTLKYVGVQSAAILNGGWQVWIAEERPIDQAIPDVTAREFEPQFQSARLMEIDELKENLESRAVTVVDTRSEAEFTGEEVRGPRGGHIPGAIHLEWKNLLQEDGRFKSVKELHTLFKQHGIEPDHRACTY